MALKDIIEGAREEAKANSVAAPKKEAQAVTEEAKPTGFSKRSAANAKPAREAASSVRLETKRRSADPLKDETKEEKKARKAREREEDDMRNRAFDVIMKSQPGFKKVDRLFWGFLIAGMVLALLSLFIPWILNVNVDFSTPGGIVSALALVLAYACIITAFVYDLRKRRPFRREAESRVANMTNRKIAELLDKDQAEKLAAEAQKDAKKAAKTAKK